MDAIDGVSDCANVTGTHLSGITGVLNLHSQNIATLRAGDFSGLGNLEQLYLGSNALTTLPANVFSGLDGLKALALEENSLLRTLDPNAFSGLVNLKELDLYLLGGTFGAAVTLASNLFSGLGALEWLYLEDANLAPLPAGIFEGLTNLKQLRLPRAAPLSFRFERVDGSDDQGSAQLRLVSVQGAPYEMTVNLASANADLSTNSVAITSVTIPAGSVASMAFDVTRITPVSDALVRITSVSEVPQPSCTGILLPIISGSLGCTRGSDITFDESAEFRLMGSPPTPSEVSITSGPEDGIAYRAGEVIRVEVTFGSAIIVNAGGVEPPTLQLDIGGQARTADYEGPLLIRTVEGGTTVLTFAYEVTDQDYDFDGISIAEDALDRGGTQIDSALANLEANLALGEHAITDESSHKVADRRFSLSLSLEPASVMTGSFSTATLMLVGDMERTTPVQVSLTPGRGLSAPSPVVLGVGETSAQFRVSADFDAPPGNSSLTASVTRESHESLRALVPSTTLRVRIDQGQREIRVFFEPSAVTLIQDGEAATVVLTTRPELQSTESLAINLRSTNALAITPDPTDGPVELSRMRGMVSVAVGAGSAATPGESELLAELDMVASELGNAIVMTESLAVEVIASDAIVVSFDLGSLMLTTTEGAAAMAVVSLSQELFLDVTVAYRIERHEADGFDPAEDTDYSPASGMVTIEAGNTTAAIVIDIIDDEEIEPTREAFKVVLEAPPPGAVPYRLASPDLTTAIVVINEGVCDRTSSVADAIVTASAGASDCDEVDDAALAGLERPLTVRIRTADDSPKRGDFEGLVNLRNLQVTLGPTAPKIFELSERMFEGLGSLEELTLTNLAISELAQGTFTGLSSLTILNLNANDFTTLTSNVFSDAGLGSTLTLLWLNTLGQLESVEAGAFSGLSGLLALSFQGSVNLQTLESGSFSGLVSLRELDMYQLGRDSEDDVVLVPDLFSELGNLERLYLEVANLAPLPAGIFEGLTNLKALILPPERPLSFRFERVDGSDDQNSAQLKLISVQGAPGELTVDLAYSNADLSTDQVTISVGGVESMPFNAMRINQNEQATVTISDASVGPAPDCEGILLGQFLCEFSLPEERYMVSFDRSAEFRLGAVSPEDSVASFRSDSLMLTTTEGTASTVVVSLSQELSGDATIAYRIEGHEADGYDPAEATDYSPSSGVVTIEAGETTAAIVIAITDDAEVEPTREAFKVVLEAPPAGASYTLGSRDQTTAIVVINEGVCDRTLSVQRAIVSAIREVSDCAEVDDAVLAGLEQSLTVQIRTVDDSPKRGDFEGLVNLRNLEVRRPGAVVIFESSERMFEGLGSLEKLDLSGLRISGFAQGTFTGLSSLTTLDLSGNDFTSLTSNVFSDAGLGSTLTILSLESNSQLESVEAGAFSGLSGLLALSFWSNVNLQTLESGTFSGLVSLRELNMESVGKDSEDEVVLAPDLFSGLGALERLYLEDANLAPLPAGIFEGLTNLKHLTLPDDVPLSFRFERVDGSDDQNSAQLRLISVQGAPGELTVDLTSSNADLSTNQVTISAGGVESMPFNAARINQNEQAVVMISDASVGPEPDCEGLLLNQVLCELALPNERYQVSFDTTAEFILGAVSPEDSVASFRSDSLMLTTTEGAEVMAVVSLSQELSGDATIAYRIEGHEADGVDPAEDTDYSPSSGMVTVEAGETTAAIVIAIINDDEIEPTREAFRVVLEAPPAGAPYTLGSPDQTTAIVVINEGVCDRTSQVQDGIVEAIDGVTDCADVTDAHLSGITGVLDLSDDNIAALRAGDFSGLGSLQQLYLGMNSLTTLPANVFSGLDGLEALALEENEALRTLDPNAFSGLVNLKELDLYLLGGRSGAAIALPPNLFSDLSALEWLYLEDANLAPLPARIFEGLTNLKQLRLPRAAPLSFRFERVDGSDDQGSAQLRLISVQGAPYEMTVRLAAANAGLSTNPVTIPAGSAASMPFDVTRRTPVANVEVRIAEVSDIPDPPCTGILLPSISAGFGCRRGSDITFDETAEFRLMGSPPTPSEVSITSSPEDGIAYRAGEVIRVEVTFGSAVIVNAVGVEPPTLQLDIGGQARTADYEGPLLIRTVDGGTTVLTFAYEVTNQDYDFDGISIAEDALDRGGAQIDSAFANLEANLALGEHAITDESSHKVANRRFSLSLSLESASVMVDSFSTATLTLVGDTDRTTPVQVSLTPGRGLSAPSPVVLGVGEFSTQFRVSVDFDAPIGNSSLTASVTRESHESLRVLVLSATLEVRIDQREIRVFFEPPAVTLVRGGEARTVVLKTEPELQGSEEVVVGLGGPAGSLGGSPEGLTVDPARVTLTPTSNAVDVTVAAGLTAALGEMDVTVTLDPGESALGSAAVTTDSLMVEVSPAEVSFESVKLRGGGRRDGHGRCLAFRRTFH